MYPSKVDPENVNLKFANYANWDHCPDAFVVVMGLMGQPEPLVPFDGTRSHSWYSWMLIPPVIW